MKKLKLTIKNLKFLIGFCFRSCPKALVIDTLFGGTVALSTVMFIVMPKLILGAVIGQKGTGHVVLLILVFAGTEFLCQYLLTFFYELADIYNQFMVQEMLVALSEKAAHIDYGALKENAVTENYHHAQNVTFQLELYTAQIFCDFFSNAVKLVTVTAVISTVSVPMVGVILAIVALKLVVSDRTKERDLAFQKEADRINVHYNYAAMLAGIPAFAKELRCYQAENFLEEKFCEARDRRLMNEAEKIRFHHRVNLIEHLLDAFSVAAGYAMIVHQYLGGAIDISMFTMYLSAVTETYDAVSEILRVLVNWNDVNRLMQEYQDFMDQPEKLRESGTLAEIPAAADSPDMVEFRDVSFRYPHQEQYALRHVNATFRVGERIGIVGENGAGKTTFVKLLMRLYDVEEGEILINGVDIRKIDYETYLRVFSVVPQDYALFFFSVLENVGFEKGREEAWRVGQALESVRMLKKLRALPKGLETFTSKIFRDGTDFSGGERQRIAIARSLFREAPVMILDEPSAAIDPLAEEQIQEAVRSISGEKLVFCISHRLSMTKDCDRILVFRDGGIAECGSHEELMAGNGIYSQMFRTQAQYYVENP